MATLSERLAIVVDVVGANKAIGDVKGLSRATSGLDGDLKKMRVGGLAVGDMLKVGIAGAATAAAGALVGLAAKGVRSFVDSTQAALQMKRATGGTAEEASALVAAFDDVGISADRGAAAMFKLAKSTGASEADLAKFGVVVAKTSGGAVDMQRTLLNVADAYNSTVDPAARAQLLVTAFGKSGADLVPILERGRAGIADLFAEAERTGQIFSPEDLARGEDFRLAMDALGDSVGYLSRSVGGFLVPVITQAANVIATLTNALAASGEEAEETEYKGIAPLGRAIDYVTQGLIDFGHAAAGFTGAAAGMGSSSGDAATGLADMVAADRAFLAVTGLVTAAVARQSQADEAQQKIVEGLKASVFGLVDAERARDQAVRGVTTAEGRLADARAEVDRLLKEGLVDTKALAGAQKDYESATKAVTRAQRDLAGAQDEVARLTGELNDLLDPKTAEEAAAAAGGDLTQAQIDQQRAVGRVGRAQARYNELLASGVATADELTEAGLDLRQANLDLTEANEDLATAEKAVSDAAKIGSENSPQVISLRGQIATATATLGEKEEGLTTALEDQKTARDDLTLAEQPDPAKVTALVTARDTVKKAEDDLKDSRFLLAERTWDVVTATDKEKEAFGLAADEAGRLKGELDKLRAAHPELAPLLAPALANLANMIGAGLAAGLGSLGPAGGAVGAGRGGPALKTFQHGGVVPGVGPRLAVVHGGERIVPGGGGGVTVNVYVSGSVVSERELVDAVHAGLVAKQRRSGNLGIEAA